MLSCRTFLPSRRWQQPVHTLWSAPLAVFEPLEWPGWEQPQEMRKGLNFMERIFAELAREFWGERTRNEKQRVDAGGEVQGKTVDEGGDGFSLSLDVPRFSPEELKVKVLGRKVLVTGKHEKKSGDGSGSYSYKYEEFRREFQLPEDVDAEAVNCCLSHDGQLKVRAPRLALPATDERIVPITIESDTTNGTRLTPGGEAQTQENGRVDGNKETKDS
ncbi:heat shock protein beta-11-like [Leucoraja erinacea]|uniref:heat shock protein beta-11-like n=1 Tax=Leucoraja erinaceus TaxID=7782 RepID=UPI00245846F9|nr:heat shock protein beta-11-like [Leucoraja erinacea]